MHPENRIDYVETPTLDIEKSKIFFGELFGWKFKDFGPDYTAYNDGVMNGGFYKSDKTSGTENGGTLVVIYAKNLESMAEKVAQHGASIVKSIFSFPGGRRFHFTEPGGSEFAVWSDK